LKKNVLASLIFTRVVAAPAVFLVFAQAKSVLALTLILSAFLPVPGSLSPPAEHAFMPHRTPRRASTKDKLVLRRAEPVLPHLDKTWFTLRF
jgi:hypothetical protein